MLVLARRIGESIIALDKNTGMKMNIVVCRVGNGQVKLGIDAPEHIEILRNELIGRKKSRRGNSSNTLTKYDGAESVEYCKPLLVDIIRADDTDMQLAHLVHDCSVEVATPDGLSIDMPSVIRYCIYRRDQLKAEKIEKT